jgi:phage tail protein X
MPNPFLLSILTLITTLATTPTIANTNFNTPNKTTTIVGSNLQANANNADNRPLFPGALLQTLKKD